MANYYSVCRTNYFRVKVEEDFESCMKNYSVEVHKNGEHYALISECESGFPALDEDDNEIEFSSVVADHLKDNEVAIFMEAGREKTRYVAGSALAINNRHETKFVDLYDIYKLAEELGENVTKAEN